MFADIGVYQHSIVCYLMHFLSKYQQVLSGKTQLVVHDFESTMKVHFITIENKRPKSMVSLINSYQLIFLNFYIQYYTICFNYHKPY